MNRVDDAKGGNHENGRRVQDAGRSDAKGWHYLPDQRSGKVPTIVMAHGFSAVKEMYLDKFAEVFAAARLGGAGLRQPKFRCERRRAAPGNRSVAAGQRLP